VDGVVTRLRAVPAWSRSLTASEGRVRARRPRLLLTDCDGVLTDGGDQGGAMSAATVRIGSRRIGDGEPVFGDREFTAIDRHCRERGIAWFGPCWDEESVDFISRFEPPCFKTASASLTDTPCSAG
jgi:hypothetical protein